ncbi:hypothetical protein SAMN04487839_102359 [Streptococcus gallolyticus]|uniref:DUF2975 domain-containing protein n=1 Tax=Streptococcus gallolyticus TaxID=315405 RepID=A0A1H7VKX2_9STRE|nr:hypothetical protein [Streptococcus gallolyticus]SEF21590.1 hypothetical protein SAMN02910295_1073 [Streptococcus gallolyticus]SEM09873.1 hypothetical protein SAMN04487839_102359 [Streptococcus gallolyticus]
MNTKTIENITKTVAINLTTIVLALTIIAELVSHIYGYDTVHVGHYGVIDWSIGKETNTWLLTALTILTNSAIIYGLAKLKAFISEFTIKEVLADDTYLLLKRATIYTFVVSLLQNVLSTSLNQANIIFDFSSCGYILLATLAVKYFRTRRLAQ